MGRAAIIVIAACGPLALAQPADHKPQAVPQEHPQPLAGPTVVDQSDQTLGDRGYDGSMPELAAPPAEAALDLLELSEAERERVSAILSERAAIFDQALSDNFESLQLYPAAEAEDNTLMKVGIIGGLFLSLEPLRDRPTLEDELRAALGPANRAAYDAILDRYRAELLARARAEAERTGTDFNGFEVALEASGKAFELEIERAFDRRFSDGAAWLEMMIRKLDLSAGQERQIRAMVLDYVQEAGLDPTQEEQEAFFLKLISRLRPDQAAELIEMVRGG